MGEGARSESTKIRLPKGTPAGRIRVACPSCLVKDETAAPRLTMSLTDHGIRAVWKRRGGRATSANYCKSLALGYVWSSREIRLLFMAS